MTFLRYLLVGASTAILQFIALAFFLEKVGFDYKIAAAFAVVVSVIFHFFANRYVTFGIEGSLQLGQIIRYLGVVLVNLLLTVGVTTLTVEVLRMDVYVGTVFSIMCTVLIGYVGSKYWVFVNTGVVRG